MGQSRRKEGLTSVPKRFSQGYPACPKAEYHAVCDKKCTDTGYGTSYAADKTKGHGTPA